MKKEGVTYTVQQVSTMVGISKQLLRKWEDRYQIITPKRLDNGYRVYRQSDVLTLQNMKQLIDGGNSPQNAAEIIKNEQLHSQHAEYPLHTKSHPLIEQLLDFGTKGADSSITQLLQQAQLTMNIEQLLHDVVSPFLRQVGINWETAVWGEYQEAMASLAVRDFLVNLRRTITISTEAPLIVGSCLPGERHEIPMHMLLIRCMMHGYQTLMLGPSPAPSAIESTVKLKNPAIVLLTASTDEPFTRRLADILTIDEFAAASPHIRFYLGGAGAFANTTPLQAIVKSNDLNEILLRK